MRSIKRKLRTMEGREREREKSDIVKDKKSERKRVCDNKQTKINRALNVCVARLGDFGALEMKICGQ